MRACCAGCARCGAGLVAALAVGLGCWEAYLRREVSAAATGAPQLGEVDIFDEANISREFFYREYVLKRRPVKIRLTSPDTFNATRFKEECNGEHRLTLISEASFTVLSNVAQVEWLRHAFKWILMPLIGRFTSLQEEMDLRTHIALRDIMASQEGVTNGGHPREFSLGMPLSLMRLMPTQLVLLLDFFARPMYLHDKALNKVCRPLLEWLHIPNIVLPTWVHQTQRLRDAPHFLKDDPALFLGRAHTRSYPMHKNIAPFDFNLIVLQGRKRYALFLANQHTNLGPFDTGSGTSIYTAEPFTPDLVDTPRYKFAQGWKGTLEAGELLYSPGDSIHVFDNFDFEKPTVAMKFWSRPHTQVCPDGPAAASEAACAEHIGLGLSQEPVNILEYKR